MIQIKDKWTGSVVFEIDGESVKLAVELAVKKEADLRGADLIGADLIGADLRGADLMGADLMVADLMGADLRGADLMGADLSGADLRGADLRGADLMGADLRGADLIGADLMGADLRGVKIKQSEINKRAICPLSGDFVAWKKLEYGLVAKLKIPSFVRRTFNLSSRKCRAELAIVLDIFDPKTNKHYKSAKNSTHFKQVEYRVGESVKPDSYDASNFIECSNGIHFFMTYDEALEWNL